MHLYCMHCLEHCIVRNALSMNDYWTALTLNVHSIFWMIGHALLCTCHLDIGDSTKDCMGIKDRCPCSYSTALYCSGTVWYLFVQLYVWFRFLITVQYCTVSVIVMIRADIRVAVYKAKQKRAVQYRSIAVSLLYYCVHSFLHYTDVERTEGCDYSRCGCFSNREL